MVCLQVVRKAGFSPGTGELSKAPRAAPSRCASSRPRRTKASRTRCARRGAGTRRWPRSRARTRRTDVVVVLRLEEGSFPRRPLDNPLLDDSARRSLEEASPRRRLVAPEPLAWERYLFYAACTRARDKIVIAREAATDDGRPLEPSPFWTEVAGLFSADEVERATHRRPLSALSWPLERAPTRREQLRAVAAVARSDATTARAIAAANGWSRQLERARARSRGRAPSARRTGRLPPPRPRRRRRPRTPSRARCTASPSRAAA